MKNILLTLFLLGSIYGFSQSYGNHTTGRFTQLNGYMQANGTSNVTATFDSIAVDTLIAHNELYVRDSTLIQLIQANSGGVTISNDANNRLTTAVGDGTLNAETNLTFDGTNLNVPGINRGIDGSSLTISGGSSSTIGGNLVLGEGEDADNFALRSNANTIIEYLNGDNRLELNGSVLFNGLSSGEIRVGTILEDGQISALNNSSGFLYNNGSGVFNYNAIGGVGTVPYVNGSTNGLSFGGLLYNSGSGSLTSTSFLGNSAIIGGINIAGGGTILATSTDLSLGSSLGGGIVDISTDTEISGGLTVSDVAATAGDELVSVNSSGVLNNSGVLVSGLSQFQVTNESNNRVITSTGTDGGNAEANLTFDGSTLIVNSLVKISGNINQNSSDGNDNLNMGIGGGGSNSSTRGGYIQVYGNETGFNPGDTRIVAGDNGQVEVDGHMSFNTEATPSTATNRAFIYGKDNAGTTEMYVMDEAGNETVISPHNFSGIPEGPSEEMAWSFYSERDGKYVNVDMLKLARLVEQLTGEKLVYIGEK